MEPVTAPTQESVSQFAARFALELAANRVEEGKRGPGGASFDPFVILVATVNPRDGERLGYPACVMVSTPDQERLEGLARIFAIAVDACASIFTAEAFVAHTEPGDPAIAREVSRGEISSRPDAREAIVQVVAWRDDAGAHRMEVFHAEFSRTENGVTWNEELQCRPGDPNLPAFVATSEAPPEVVKEAQRIAVEMGLKVFPIVGRA